VIVGSTLAGPAAIRPGRTVACGDDRQADGIREQVSRAYRKTPERLRPASVTVHLKPDVSAGVARIRGIEFHRASRSLLVERAPEEPSAWLHELAHVRMGARLPAGPLGRRLFAALEEGIADYQAACISGSTLVGGVRDLERPPRLRAEHWASLALPRLSFDPHRIGWPLAARFYRIEPRPGTLLDDLVACMARTLPPTVPDTPGALIDAWLGGCPPRSRDRIRSALRGWLPGELWDG
jgi:hypothetical protein